MSSDTVSSKNTDRVRGRLGHASAVDLGHLKMVFAVAYTAEGATKVAGVLTEAKGWIQPSGPNNEGNFVFSHVPDSKESFDAARHDAFAAVEPYGK
jgi:hypothetical protein